MPQGTLWGTPGAGTPSKLALSVRRALRVNEPASRMTLMEAGVEQHSHTRRIHALQLTGALPAAEQAALRARSGWKDANLRGAASLRDAAKGRVRSRMLSLLSRLPRLHGQSRLRLRIRRRHRFRRST